MKAKIFRAVFSYNRWDWEMNNGRIYVCSYPDKGYASKYGAARALKAAAKKLGIEIKEIEYDEG